MTPTTLALIMLLAQVGMLFCILYLRYLDNKKLFKSDSKLQPIRSKNRFFGAFSGLYDFLDSIPFLRRSGTANEFDLLKAMLLVTVPMFAFELLLHRPSALIALAAANVLMLLVNGIVFAHVSIKRRLDKNGPR